MCVTMAATPLSALRYLPACSYLLSLFFLRYFEVQLPQGRLPSHLVLRERQRSQLAHKATGSLSAAAPFVASFVVVSILIPLLEDHYQVISIDMQRGALLRMSLRRD